MARIQGRVVVLDPSGSHNPASQLVGGAGGQFGAVSQNETKQVLDHVANPPTHPSLHPAHPRTKMSVQLSPSSNLGFRRPLTSLVKRSLTITNNNAQPIAFKVKTTAPKLYCVRPNSGRVEPGESQEVSVMLQAMKEEPPLNAKCKDKFLIQSTTITPDKEAMSLAEIWANTDANEDGRVHQQKLRVTYLPAEGQTLEEEDENPVGMTSIISQPDSNILDPAPQHPNGNGNAPIPSTFTAFTTSAIPDAQQAAASTSAPVSREPSQEEAQTTVVPPVVPVIPEIAPRSPTPPPFPVPEPAPAPEPVVQPPVQQPVYSPPEEPKVIPQLYQPSPAPVPAPAPAPAPEPIIITKENPVNKELLQENKVLKAEIERLKNELAVKFTQPPPVTELRRRRHSDAASESDVQTAVEEPIQQQDGVPLNIVVAISFAVFFTTYLFF